MKFNLKPLDADLNRLTGVDSLHIRMLGTGPDGIPQGSVSFTALDGWTVNGAPSVEFDNFTTIPLFVGFWMLDAQDIIVHQVS